jgi:hypothetical protein
MSELELEETGEDRPLYILHPLRGVVWAAFWGTPVAAGIVMGINYWRTGQKSAARNVVALGVIVTVMLFMFLVAIPEELLDSIPNVFFYIPQLVLVSLYAKALQNELIEKHIANGGTMASAWPSVGIGAVCLIVVLFVLFGVVLFLER